MKANTTNQNRLTVLILLLALVTLLPACNANRGPPEEAADDSAVQTTEFETLSGNGDNQLRLFTRLAGRAEDDCLLIAINGGPGLSSDYMRDLEQLAQQGCTVATYDQRGTGRSSLPPVADSPASYTLDLYTADLEAVRQEVVLKRPNLAGQPANANLLGHSFGAIVAMHYATLHPQNVVSLIFYGGGPPTAAAMNLAQVRFGQRLEQLIVAGQLAPPEEWTADGIEPILPVYFSDPTFTFPDEGGPSYSAQVNELTYVNLAGLNLPGALAALELPVLVLFGRDDPFGLEMAQATVDALTGADLTYTLLDDCGHFWQECPEPFFEQLVAFLGLE